MKNNSKLIRYQYILKKLDEAIKLDFDIQAIAYAYALIEDRFNSFLIYCQIKPSSNKIKDKIKTFATILKNANLLNHPSPDPLREQILSWIDKRNQIMHGMAMVTLEQAFIKEVALTGKKLVIHLNRISPKIKKLTETIEFTSNKPKY